MASLDMVPNFELIFIQFPKQNYSLSLILEATDTVETIKDKYNSEYHYHINYLGPQHTLTYKGRVLKVDDELRNLPKNSVLDVLECTQDISSSKGVSCDEKLSPSISNNSDDDHSRLLAADSEKKLSPGISNNSNDDQSELLATNSEELLPSPCVDPVDHSELLAADNEKELSSGISNNSNDDHSELLATNSEELLPPPCDDPLDHFEFLATESEELLPPPKGYNLMFLSCLQQILVRIQRKH